MREIRSRYVRAWVVADGWERNPAPVPLGDADVEMTLRNADIPAATGVVERDRSFHVTRVGAAWWEMSEAERNFWLEWLPRWQEKCPAKSGRKLWKACTRKESSTMKKHDPSDFDGFEKKPESEWTERDRKLLEVYGLVPLTAAGQKAFEEKIMQSSDIQMVLRMATEGRKKGEA